MNMRVFLLLTLAGFGCVAGCGPGVGTVTGEVTVNKEPLEDGVIVFAPAEGEGKPVTAAIKNGKYTIETTPGKKFVQISAPIVVSKRKESDAEDAAWVDVTEEWLPDRYHAKTELTVDVSRGSSTKDWHLEAKARPK